MDCCNCAGYHEENLDWLISEIKRVLDEMDGDYTKIYAYIDNGDFQTLRQSKSYTDSQITQVYSKIEQNRNVLMVMIDNLYSLIQSTNNSTKAWMLEQIAELEKKINESANNILVVNPVSDMLDSLQNTLNDMYNIFRNGLSCYEYQALKLTCDEYKNKCITCRQYAINGKELLQTNYCNLVVHPLTGKFVTVQVAIAYLASLHRTKALTCGEYASKSLTCLAYKNLAITCTQYSWDSKTLIQ